MSFHEVQFPTTLSFGAIGGPERRTDIVTLSNGYEERNTPWAHSRRRYDAGVALRSLDDIEVLIAFFEARGGQMHGFRWKDWADYKTSRASQPVAYDDQVFATGDGSETVFQLAKHYRSGAQAYLRPIRKPVLGSLRVGIEADELQENLHYTVDYTTGLITFERAPEIGQEISAGFEFDVPVRFDSDHIHVSVASFQAGEAPQVPVVEVRL